MTPDRVASAPGPPQTLLDAVLQEHPPATRKRHTATRPGSSPELSVEIGHPCVRVRIRVHRSVIGTQRSCHASTQRVQKRRFMHINKPDQIYFTSQQSN